MEKELTALPDVYLLRPKRFMDGRGWFEESWNKGRLAELGIDLDFVQDNHSFSTQKGTLRGLHCQRPPAAQAKLVRCTRGAIWDVAVDVRRRSPRFGEWVGVELSARNGRQLLIPEGFLHGFITLEPDCEVQYKCTDYYSPAADETVRYDDPDLAIRWPDTGCALTLSSKDEAGKSLAAFDSPF